MTVRTRPVSYHYSNHCYYSDPNGNVFPVTNDDKEIVWTTDVKNGSSVPGWKTIIAKRGNASSNYTRVGGSVNPGTYSGEKRIISNLNVYEFQGTLAPVLSTDASDQVWLKDQALHKLNLKLRSISGSIQTGPMLQDVYELRGLLVGSAHLAVDTLKYFINLKRDLRTGRLKLKQVHQLAAEAWLTYSFGIMPTVSDVSDLMNAMRDKYLTQPMTVSISASAKTDWNTSSWNDLYTTSTADMRQTNRFEHQLSYRYKGGFTFLLQSANDYTAFDHYGLNLTDVPSIIWELAPWTWIADYFSNAGDYFSDAWYVPPGTFQYLNLDTLYTLTSRAFAEVHNTNPNFIVKGSSSAAQGTFYSFARTKLSSLPVGGLHLKSVDTVGKYWINKVLNLAAVAAR